MRAILGLVTKYTVPLLFAVILGLGFAVKWAVDSKNGANERLAMANQTIEQTASDLAHERAKQAALTLALVQAERRSQAISEANTRLSEEVSRELQANPEWSRADVPRNVVDSLCGQFTCAESQQRGE